MVGVGKGTRGGRLTGGERAGFVVTGIQGAGELGALLVGEGGMRAACDGAAGIVGFDAGEEAEWGEVDAVKTLGAMHGV
jgi:hypothetical protein